MIYLFTHYFIANVMMHIGTISCKALQYDSVLHVTGKDVSRPEHTTSAAYDQAAQVLDSVVTSILSWEVTVENIDTITRNVKNFENIVRCYYWQADGKAGVDCDNLLQRTKKLASDVTHFEDTRRKLYFLCEKCSLVMPVSGRGRG